MACGLFPSMSNEQVPCVRDAKYVGGRQAVEMQMQMAIPDRDGDGQAQCAASGCEPDIRRWQIWASRAAHGQKTEEESSGRCERRRITHARRGFRASTRASGGRSEGRRKSWRRERAGGLLDLAGTGVSQHWHFHDGRPPWESTA